MYKIIIFYLFFASTLLHAQSKQSGLVKYVYVFESKHKDTLKRPQLNTINSEETYLYFNQQESSFIHFAEEKQEVKSGDGYGNNYASAIKLGSDKDLIIYKNLLTKELIDDAQIFDRAVVIKDTLKPISWEIDFTSKRNIGGFECIKATSNYRGRLYTAWFAEKIPVSTGPWKLYGLPGLILEAYDHKNQVLFLFKDTKIGLDVSKNIRKPSSSKKTISYKEYSQDVRKKVADMQRSAQQKNSNVKIEISGTIEPLDE